MDVQTSKATTGLSLRAKTCVSMGAFGVGAFPVGQSETPSRLSALMALVDSALTSAPSQFSPNPSTVVVVLYCATPATGLNPAAARQRRPNHDALPGYTARIHCPDTLKDRGPGLTLYRCSALPADMGSASPPCQSWMSRNGPKNQGSRKEPNPTRTNAEQLSAQG